MLKVKSIEKKGNKLKIIVKKPHHQDYTDFLIKNKLCFESDWYDVCYSLAICDDVEIVYRLSTYKDFFPYVKSDWFVNELKNMVKNNTAINKQNAILLHRDKDSLTKYNFNISIDKKLLDKLIEIE